MVRGGRFARAWLAVVAVLAGLALPVQAENIGITGRKLVVLDKREFSNRSAVRFLSIDPKIRKGSGTSVATIGATLDITIDAFNQRAIGGAFSVPQGFSTTAGWRVNNSSLAKFVNPGAPGGPTQVRVLTVKQNHLVKISAKGLGDLPINLDDLYFAPYHVQVRFTVLNGAEMITHCTIFPSENCALPLVGAGTGMKLQCTHGEAVPDCAFPSLP